MRFLGIDPGYDRVGIAVVEKTPEQAKETVVFSECFETDKQLEVTERLFKVGERIQETLDTYSPDALALETLFFNKNQKTAMSVAGARGAILYLAQKSNCKIYEYHPQEIKVAVTGYGKSDKAAVMMMVKQLVDNCPEKAIDDEYDAIAIALTGLAHEGRTQ